jgi:hypothetical protein
MMIIVSPSVPEFWQAAIYIHSKCGEPDRPGSQASRAIIWVLNITEVSNGADEGY